MNRLFRVKSCAARSNTRGAGERKRNYEKYPAQSVYACLCAMKFYQNSQIPVYMPIARRLFHFVRRVDINYAKLLWQIDNGTFACAYRDTLYVLHNYTILTSMKWDSSNKNTCGRNTHAGLFGKVCLYLHILE